MLEIILYVFIAPVLMVGIVCILVEFYKRTASL